MLRRPPRSTPFPTRRSSDLRFQRPAPRNWRRRGGCRGFRRHRRHGHCDCRGSRRDRKSTRLNSSHVEISYAVFCLKKKKKKTDSLTTSYIVELISSVCLLRI